MAAVSIGLLDGAELLDLDYSEVGHFTDPDVFIRSMASRGHLGGLAGATADAVSLMDAFGKDVVLVETVGVGQSEIEIAEVADTTLVALQPGSGDSVQVLMAGVLEIADVFVVNKSDHPMALQLQREIRSMMEMLSFEGWVPKLVSTQALEGKGIDALWNAIAEHDAWLRETGADVAFYHAGVGTAERAQVERYFREGAIRVVVATSAFGEGIERERLVGSARMCQVGAPTADRRDQG